MDKEGYVLGTRQQRPVQCLRSKYEALFDDRPIFDAIRFDFLVSADPSMKLDRVINMLESMNAADAMPNELRKKIARFIEDLTESNTSRRISTGFDFKAWEAYVSAISSTSSGYYSSIDELLLLCQLELKNVVVYKHQPEGLRYAGSWLRGVGDLVAVKLRCNE